MTYSVSDLAKILSTVQEENVESKFEFEFFCTNKIKATVTWKINDFYPLIVHNTELTHRVVCKLGSNDRREYNLKLVPNSIENGRPKTLGLSMDLISCYDNAITSCVTFFLIEDNGNPIKIGTQVGPSAGKKVYFEDVHRIHNSSGFPLTKINVLCEIMFTVNEKSSKSKYFINLDTLQNISEDFAKLLEKEQLSDVELKTNDGNFKVHRSILSVRSPVFAAMFNHDTKESREGKVNIIDIESNILRILLEFMYTGRLGDVENKVHDLFKAADKYEVKELKTKCENILLINLSVDNVVDTLILADLHTIEHVKTKSFAFIRENFKEVIKTPQFQNLLRTDPDLVMDILTIVAVP